MDALNDAFKILTYFGFWKPESWTYGWKSKCYDCIRVILLPLPYYIAVGQVMLIIVKARSIDEMTETLFLVLTTLNACCKATNVLARRRDVRDLMKMVNLEMVKPRDEVETTIYRGSNNIIRFSSNLFKR